MPPASTEDGTTTGRPQFGLIVALSGHVAVGKTTLATGLNKLIPESAVVSTRRILTSLGPESADRRSLQRLGSQLDSETGGAWVAEAIVQSYREPSLIVDSVRTLDQIQLLREIATTALHVHLQAEMGLLESRYTSSGRGENRERYDDVLRDPTEARVDELGGRADLCLNTGSWNIEGCRQLAYQATVVL